MTTSTSTIIMRVPLHMALGGVPADITTHAETFSFALASIQKIFNDRDIAVTLEGEQAIVTFSEAGQLAQSYTRLGAVLENRHFKVDPTGDLHRLALSIDGGISFSFAGDFANHDFARSVGEAWCDGRVEKSA